MRRLTWTMAFAGAALTVLIAADAARAQTAAPAAPAAPAAAQAAAPSGAAPAPKKAKKKSAATVAVTVQNSRSAALVKLEASVAGADKFKTVLGKLAPGKKAGATVPRGKDCQIDLHATFADGQTTEAAGVDVCAQKLLNLTD